ncbi:MAG: hypothetical protein U0835_26020 [Isosphaeraceae bacterium]
MSVETARLLLIGITVIGGVFWVFSTLFFSRAVQSEGLSEPRTPGGGWSKGIGIEGPTGDDVLTGEVEAEGKPAELSARLAETLGRNGLAGMLVRVLEGREDRVVFDLLPMNRWGRSSAGGPAGGLRAEVTFRSAGAGRCRMEYALATGTGRGLIRAGWVLVTLGLFALVGGFFLLDLLVVQNSNPGVRFQAFQMVQCVHLLWPPLLIGSLYRQQRTAHRCALEVLLANLPYV